MGLNLVLMPIERLSPDRGYAHSRLELDQYPELFDKIDQGMQIKLDGFKFNGYLDKGYGRITKDALGNPLMAMQTSILVNIIDDHYGNDFDRHIQTKAACAYLKALIDQNIKLIYTALYWH